MAEVAKDKREKKYKPIGRAASGTPIYGGRVDDLRRAIRSQRRGFEVSVNLTNKQAKNLSPLVEKARAEGVTVAAFKKKDYAKSGFSYKAVGYTNVPNGFQQGWFPNKDTGEKEYRGRVAQEMFESYGGKIKPIKEGNPLSGKITIPRPGKSVKGVRLAPNYFGIFKRKSPMILVKKKKGKNKKTK